MSNDALINELTANLAPVERRSVLRETGFIVALGFVELALFLGVGLMRPDMGNAIGFPVARLRNDRSGMVLIWTRTGRVLRDSPYPHRRIGRRKTQAK